MTAYNPFDPRLYDAASVDSKTEIFNRRLEEMLAAMPPFYTRSPQRVRTAQEEGKGMFGPIKFLNKGTDRTVRGAGREVSVRVYLPDTVSGIYFHLHGGGFMLGHPNESDRELFQTAETCRMAVVSVDYRLAPEHPHPAAPDDCEAAAVWLVENGAEAFGVERIVIGGESAGANLAAVTLQRMRDRHGYTGFAGANFVYGVFDLSMTPSQRNWGERELILSTPAMKWFHDHYVTDPETIRHPDISPLYGDLSRMPPALFTVGTLDPMLDDSMFMHARWVSGGNRAELAVYPGGTHVFNLFPTPIAKEANGRIHAFLQDCQTGDADRDRMSDV